jgi:hypothetical protein
MHRPHAQTGFEHDLAGSDISAGLTYMGAFSDHGVNPHFVAFGSRVLDTHDGVSTIRHRSASHDPDGLTVSHGARRDLTGGHVTEHREKRIGLADIYATDRETIHGRVGKVGHVLPGYDRFGQDPADTFVERNGLGVELSYRSQYLRPN